jgi:hypothetical protein
VLGDDVAAVAVTADAGNPASVGVDQQLVQDRAAWRAGDRRVVGAR